MLRKWNMDTERSEIDSKKWMLIDKKKKKKKWVLTLREVNVDIDRSKWCFEKKKYADVERSHWLECDTEISANTERSGFDIERSECFILKDGLKEVTVDVARSEWWFWEKCMQFDRSKCSCWDK